MSCHPVVNGYPRLPQQSGKSRMRDGDVKYGLRVAQQPFKNCSSRVFPYRVLPRALASKCSLQKRVVGNQVLRLGAALVVGTALLRGSK